MLYFLLLLPLTVWADAAPPAKVGLINMQKAIQSVGEGKKAQDTLRKEWESRQKKLQTEGKKIQAAVEELRKQAMVMDDKSRREKEESIQANVMKLREEEAKNASEFQKRDMEISEPIIKKIKKLVSDVSKEKGYTIVLDANENNVIYAIDENDITNEVIKRYDKK